MMSLQLTALQTQWNKRTRKKGQMLVGILMKRNFRNSLQSFKDAAREKKQLGVSFQKKRVTLELEHTFTSSNQG